jgi:hypothetical protein
LSLADGDAAGFSRVWVKGVSHHPLPENSRTAAGEVIVSDKPKQVQSVNDRNLSGHTVLGSIVM